MTETASSNILIALLSKSLKSPTQNFSSSKSFLVHLPYWEYSQSIAASFLSQFPETNLQFPLCLSFSLASLLGINYSM